MKGEVFEVFEVFGESSLLANDRFELSANADGIAKFFIQTQYGLESQDGFTIVPCPARHELRSLTDVSCGLWPPSRIFILNSSLNP